MIMDDMSRSHETRRLDDEYTSSPSGSRLRFRRDKENVRATPGLISALC